MSSSALNQLGQFQQSLYEKAYKEAHAIVAGTSRALLAYSAQFERSLPGQFRRSTLGDLLDQLREARFLLYGDFHTLRQSQRGLLRVVRSYSDKLRTNKIVFALEMFKAIDQPFVDDYLAGRLDEEGLLEAVRYDETWGFPWKNFKMILDFAASRGMPVIGINTENAGRDGLADRDHFAAIKLVDAAQTFPDHRIVCLIGEYHLADSHLPKILKAEARRRQLTGAGQILRVLNNVDAYYFQLMKQAGHASTEYLRLRKDFYCIMNSPPWMKWHSFSMWEEMRHAGHPQLADQDGEIDHDLDLHTEESFDVDWQFLQFVKNLASFLKLKVDDSDLEMFQIQFSPSGNFFDQLMADGNTTVDDAERIIERASLDGVHFLCKPQRVLLTYVSINNLAEGAGQYLHTLVSGFEDTGSDPGEEFLRRTLKAAIGLVASKILNPRRKCLELHHYRQLLRRARRDAHRQGAYLHLETAHAVLKFDNWIRSRIDSGNESSSALAVPPKRFIEHDRESAWELSREVGKLLGYNLYKKVFANKESAASLRRLFTRKVTGAGGAWREVVALYQLLL